MKKYSNLRPWMPGQSGNPGGRPKSLVGAVRNECGDNGERIVETLVMIAFGTPAALKKTFGKSASLSTKDRLTALKELADRGFGRSISEATAESLGVLENTQPIAPPDPNQDPQERMEVIIKRFLERLPEEKLQRILEDLKASKDQDRRAFPQGRLLQAPADH